MTVSRSFTLVELMIVVAIIGVLAAVTGPRFIEMQYKYKRAEVPSNVDGLAVAAAGYEAVYGAVPTVIATHPRSIPDKTAVHWTAGSIFDELGWRPDGAVRGVYGLEGPSWGGGGGGDGGGDDYGFVARGACDVDADGEMAAYLRPSGLSVRGPFLWNGTAFIDYWDPISTDLY